MTDNIETDAQEDASGSVFFSPSTLGLYRGENRAFFEELGSWPADAKALTAKQVAEFSEGQPAGKVLAATAKGSPKWVDYVEAAPVSIEEAQQRRSAAYRAESDPLKIEAEFDALEAGAEPDYTNWRAKVKEIKERFPMPAVS
jgi:hypothetical protein